MILLSNRKQKVLKVLKKRRVDLKELIRNYRLVRHFNDISAMYSQSSSSVYLQMCFNNSRKGLHLLIIMVKH
jgi:hypothetical protein